MGIALSSLSKSFSEMKKLQGAGARLFEFMENPKLLETNEINREQVDSKSLLPIEFSNVNFSYPSRNETPILSNLNLTFSDNDRITAIVGSSGSGKSTVAQLLLGLYQPQSG